MPVAQFFTGPGTTVLARGEVVASIDLPIPEGRTGASFTRLTRRRGVDLASLTVSCLIKASGEANIAFGAVAPTPLVIRDDGAIVEEIRRHSSVSDATLERLIARSSPISDVRAGRDYRLAMLRVFIRRALKRALSRLEEASR